MIRDRRLARIVAVALALGAAARPARAQLDPRFDPHQLVTPPLGLIKPVTPERLVLGNGVVVFLLENHELPVIEGTMRVRTTPAW